MGLDVKFHQLNAIPILTGFGDEELVSRVVSFLGDLETTFTVPDVGTDLLPATIHPNLFQWTYDLGYRYYTDRVRVPRAAAVACARGTGETLWILAIYRYPGGVAPRAAALAGLAPVALHVAVLP